MSYAIDVKDKTRKLTLSGALVGQDLPELVEQLNAAHISAPQALNIVADVSGLSDIEIDIASMENFAKELLRLSLPENIKIAFVAKSLIQYSYAESFRIILDHPQIEVQVFQNEMDAQRWLSEMEKK